VDGVIATGETEVDESAATGEPLPVAKAEGSPVLRRQCQLDRHPPGPGGAGGRRQLRRPGGPAGGRGPGPPPSHPSPGRPDCSVLRPLVLLLALVTFAGWLLHGASGATALLAALATVLIACPCALGLATPTAILAGMGRAAEEGVIFRGGDVLERLARTTAVAFDKTGTLTLGRPAVSAVIPAPGVNNGELWHWLRPWRPAHGTPWAWASLPPRRSKVSRCRSPARSGACRAADGRRRCRAADGPGSARFLEGEGIGLPAGLPEPPAGGSAVLAAVDGRYAGALLLTDALRPGMAELVVYFAEQGITATLLSGDRPESARQVATTLGIAEARGT